MAADNAEKTEKPSQKRLKDARERGQVPRSRDLSLALSSLAMTIALGTFGPSLAARLASRLAGAIAVLGDRPLAAITAGELRHAIVADGAMVLVAAGPLLAIAAIVGVGGTVAQSGWVFAPQALTVNWERLSPAQGLARLAPKQSGVDLLKTIVSVTVLSVLSWRIVEALMARAPMLAWMAPADAARTAWSAVLQLLWQAAVCACAIGVADYGVQFWRVRLSLKMTRQELRDESKSNEGNPEIKSRVRRIQRDMSRRRMLTAVRTATVVITNPTHYAVALEYRRAAMAAPVVVAKGADHLAARIRAAAREHGVPTIENVSLAQALYRGADVGDTIPAPLFGAVAEVLAYLVRIKQLML